MAGRTLPPVVRGSNRGEESGPAPPAGDRGALRSLRAPGGDDSQERMAPDQVRLEATFRAASRVGLLALVAAVLWWVQFGFAHSFGDPDAYYHAAVARLIAQQGEPSGFPWMQFTTWRDHYADQHFLYHVLLIPFADVGRLPWSIVVFSTGAAAALLWLVASFGLRAPGLWLFLFVFGSADFLYRISIVKANTLSIVFLLAAIVLLRRKRHGWLLPLSLLFVWVYGGFVFVPMVVVTHGLVVSVFERRLVWKPAACCVCGLVLGFLLHPQAGNLAYHLYSQMFQAGLGASAALGVGVEWSPYGPAEFWRINGLVAGVYLLACGVFLRESRGAARDHERGWQLTLLILSAVFFVLAVRSRRFVEYFVPFAIVFAASVLSPFLDRSFWRRCTATARSRAVTAVAVVLGGAALAWGAAGTTLTVWTYFHNVKAVPADRYRAAAEWMRDLSREGDVVCNTRWDQFAQLFYWNQKNYYIVGMDPTFLYLYDRSLYGDWRRLSDDAADLSAEEIHDTCAKKFRATLVFVERYENPRLMRLLAGSPQFREIFTDPFVAVYAVR